jgi:MinD superfamily P-loop ATPase
MSKKKVEDKSETKKLVVFSIGGKGGVGKSWLICLLIDWYKSLSLKFHAVDLDNENSTLSRSPVNATSMA